MNKFLGYIIAILGIAILATGFLNEARSFVQNSLKINISQFNDIALIVAGIVIAILGFFLVSKSSSHVRRSSGSKQKVEEVPIYHGKEIVGYRKH